LPATTFGPSVKKPEEIEPMERAFEKALGLDFSGNHDWRGNACVRVQTKDKLAEPDAMNSDNASFFSGSVSNSSVRDACRALVVSMNDHIPKGD
jgi:hypothetical protein